MSESLYAALAVGITAAVTALLRFAPFAVFRDGKEIPPWLKSLGRLLPYAVMGMLVVYCLRGTQFSSPAGFVPQLVGVAAVTGTYIWKRSTLLSILCGTVCYMLLVQLVF